MPLPTSVAIALETSLVPLAYAKARTSANNNSSISPSAVGARRAVPLRRDRAAAGGASAGGAAVAVHPSDDSATGQQGEIELVDGLWHGTFDGQVEHLIEVAV